MDKLLEAAREYAKLINIDFIYTLENGIVLQVYFIPSFFYHLIGLQKLVDIPLVQKGPRNNPGYIFRNILRGKITLTDIQKSRHFSEIESRVKHFSQINMLVEFERIIVDFDSTLINSKMINADYILFKKSNDNMHLNLFLKTDDNNKQVPLTFISDRTDYYTHRQKMIEIVSITKVVRS